MARCCVLASTSDMRTRAGVDDSEPACVPSVEKCPVEVVVDFAESKGIKSTSLQRDWVT